MRRRQQQTETSTRNCPLELWRFDPDDWSGTPLEAAGHWYAARDAFEERGGVIPDGCDPSSWPDAPFDASQV